MNSRLDPLEPYPNPLKRNRINGHDEESPSSSTPNQELVPNFPSELIIEILYRLPAKSLVKFKCVSRSWLSLISSPRFIKTHLAIASGRDGYGHHGLILTVLPPNSCSYLKQYSVSSVLYGTTTPTTTTTTTTAITTTTATEVTDIDYPLKSPSKSFWVVGSCNGLVCVSVEDKDLFLWNPCIGKSKQLPDIGMEMKHGCFMMFGLGYDELNDDYKVVRIFCTFGGGVPYETEVKVYSLKKNSWSRIGDFEGGIPLIDSGQYASGNLHWAASHGVDNWKIVSLDLAKETYGEVERPNCKESVSDWTIGVLGGCLSVLYDCLRDGADVWVLKDYGDKDSWTKVVSVPYLDYPCKLGRSLPICLLGNGGILLVFRSVLVFYDPNSNTFRWYPQINELEDATMCVESLVSPNLRDGE